MVLSSGEKGSLSLAAHSEGRGIALPEGERGCGREGTGRSYLVSPGPLGLGREGRGMTGAGRVDILCHVDLCLEEFPV